MEAHATGGWLGMGGLGLRVAASHHDARHVAPQVEYIVRTMVRWCSEHGVSLAVGAGDDEEDETPR